MVTILDTTESAQKTKLNLLGLNRKQLADFLTRHSVPDKSVRMRVNQLWNWIYKRGVTDFDDMGNVSKELRQVLKETATIERPEIVVEQISQDGTRKWLLRLPSAIPGIKGPEVETVYIPEENRGTLCISSQVGCTLTCSFCHTGTQKLAHNLTPGEIISQVLVARDRLGDWPDQDNPKDGLIPSGDRAITNVVLMGMGEPLYNYENVKEALHVLSDNEGISLSKRRITLSTSGVVPLIEKVGEETGVMLAISLHAAKDHIRDTLVPINKKYPIEKLLAACKAYPGLSNAKRITFEYVMLKDVNDSLDDAKELVRLLKGIPSKINLIPFNPWPDAPYECSSWEQIERFAEVVNKAGYASPIRTPRGRDIMAACGQLKSDSKKISKAETKRIMEQI